MKYFMIYIIIINLISFYVMYDDKKKAKKHSWRTPENKLFLFAAVFGSLGIWGGMYFFRHKTKHPKFVIGIPLILLIQVYLIYRFGLL